MIVTTLYFGRNRRAGKPVSQAEWDSFVANEITPRFPDFTMENVIGYWHGEREQTFKLTLAHNDTLGHVDEIRRAYCERFAQDSVMRVDDRQALVTF